MAAEAPASAVPVGTTKRVGRYLIFDTFAAGGMASVSFGRMLGPLGIWRTVAIKQMQGQYLDDNQAVAMFIDEARLSSRIVHPNVVPTVDVVLSGGALLIVMEYIEGESLYRLLSSAQRSGNRPPPSVVSAILLGALAGLHAAHELRDERDVPLDVVHRDVSPQNILVGIDGVARVIDFGIAKAEGRLQDMTAELQLKGKARYMAPEQVRHEPVDRRADIFSAAVVLWEALAGQRLFEGQNVLATLRAVAEDPVKPLSLLVGPHLSGVDAVVQRALNRDPALRFETARAFADALEHALPPAASAEVARWVATAAGEELAERARARALVERQSLHVEATASKVTQQASPADTPESETTATVSFGGAEPAPLGEAADSATPGRAPRRRVVWGVVAATACAAILWVIIRHGGDATLIKGHVAEGSTVHPSSARSAPAAAPDAAATALPSVSLLPLATAVPKPAPTLAPSRTTSIGKRRKPQGKALPTSRAPAATGAPKRDCDVPWVFTPQGVRIPKPGCFSE